VGIGLITAYHFGHLMATLCSNKNNSEVDTEILHVLSVLLELYNSLGDKSFDLDFFGVY